ncbi:hypothetical protein QQF64_033998 [Cirrhinus molitorella]|uniref:EF-hand domain-containing protein n=1 Tax=Cirrhinus molitorella TaxID=172907 RepID=A0ABR3MVI4_9TELE
MSAEAAVMDFFNVCNALYKYCKKPTIAAHYKGERLKRLLEQRWTGHLATVSVLLNNYKEITSLLTEIDSVRDEGFAKVWEKATAAADALPNSTSSKRRRTLNKNMDDYLVEETTGQREDDVKTELKRLYYSTIDSVAGEMDQRFSERNSHLYRALTVLDPDSDSFLDPETVKHIMELTQSPICDAEFEVAKTFLMSQNRKQRGTTGPQNLFSPSTTKLCKQCQVY